MRIFVSWSGTESKLVAELLRDWLPHVVQSADLYVSSQDIEKGERWSVSVSTNLSELDFGIIVVTPANIDAPWVNFEAGALSKSVKARVIPLLCGMERIDAAGSPLRQFQYALATKDDIFRLVSAVNDACSKPLDAARFEQAFNKWWPEFSEPFAKFSFSTASQGPKTENDSQFGKIEAALEAIMSDMSRMRRDVATVRNPQSFIRQRTGLMPEWVDHAYRAEQSAALEKASKAALAALQAADENTEHWTETSHPNGVRRRARRASEPDE